MLCFNIFKINTAENFKNSYIIIQRSSVATFLTFPIYPIKEPSFNLPSQSTYFLFLYFTRTQIYKSELIIFPVNEFLYSLFLFLECRFKCDFSRSSAISCIHLSLREESWVVFVSVQVTSRISKKGPRTSKSKGW